MIKKHNKHTGYYLSLGTILLFGLLFTLQLSAKKEQVFVVVLLTFFYVLWGILHHIIHHNITTKIVIEYIIIGILGMTIILFLIQTGV